MLGKKVKSHFLSAAVEGGWTSMLAVHEGTTLQPNDTPAKTPMP